MVRVPSHALEQDRRVVTLEYRSMRMHTIVALGYSCRHYSSFAKLGLEYAQKSKGGMDSHPAELGREVRQLAEEYIPAALAN